MTEDKKTPYREDAERLGDILNRILSGHRFLLDCGDFVTFNCHPVGDSITYNEDNLKITCAQHCDNIKGGYYV